MNEHKYLLSELVGDFSTLTDMQYAILRDAGYDETELIRKTQSFYARVRESIKYNGQHAKPSDLQIAYLQKHDVKFDYDLEDITFGICRRAIRMMAKKEGTDVKYLRYMDAYEKDNAARASRKRGSNKNLGMKDGDQSDAEDPLPAVDDEMEEFMRELGFLF